jgi:hypothetical protein
MIQYVRQGLPFDPFSYVLGEVTMKNRRLIIAAFAAGFAAMTVYIVGKASEKEFFNKGFRTQGYEYE